MLIPQERIVDTDLWYKELRTEAFDTETPDDLIVYCSDTSVSGDSSSEFWLSNRDDYTFTLNEDLVHLASYHDSDGSHEELTFFTNQNLDKHSILVAEFLADFADVFEHEAAMARVFN